MRIVHFACLKQQLHNHFMPTLLLYFSKMPQRHLANGTVKKSKEGKRELSNNYGSTPGTDVVVLVFYPFVSTVHAVLAYCHFPT